jgi:hypothetical protein
MTDHNHLEKSQTNEDNRACVSCNNLLCNLESGEGGIKCTKCNLCAHKECAGVGDEDNEQKYVCDFC